MNTSLDPENELSNAPNLKQMKGQSSLRAPEGYFESLSSVVQDRIQSDQKNKTPSFFLRPAVLVTSLLLIIISTGIIWNIKQQKENTTQAAVSLTYDDVIESGYYTEIDETILSESLAANTVSTEKADKQIEDYILNNSDESQLLNELPL